MNNTIHDLLVNLKIISKIPENGRLKRNNKAKITILALEENNVNLFWFRRFMSGDSRKKALEDITDIIDLAFEKCDDILNSKYFNEPTIIKEELSKSIRFAMKKIDAEYRKNYEILELIYQELKNCTTGISNLKTTYHDDAATIAALDIILSRIKNYIKEMERCVIN